MLEADPSKEIVDNYLLKGSCFVMVYKEDIVGVVIITEVSQYENEIVNLAIQEKYRGKGLAKQLINSACDYSRKKGKKFIIVGTGNSSINQLALYQKCGFRIDYVKRNYFLENYTDLIVENGIPCLDMVMLKKIIG
ncbi:ribosomal protein S18 acetylase RimI-like enzyme [Metabacillus crassostreae]|uniref:GNAT family N-acetyltransferase n=1 Tax=Metabacillus crassostreae TaxID=929098 RepID=UPI001EF76AAD|nr:GNAT family N-acetyltransferase [Metabacillus crassostreae]MBM7603608.1 ribosomal protein S18 acetylase RimI-like enzyme [Metabacillus crassostreae]